MTRALLDTNVLASGIAGLALPASLPGELLRQWRRKRFTLVISTHVLNELQRTLTKPYFTSRISASQRSQMLGTLRHRTEIATITVNVFGVAAHPEDDLVLAAAVSAQVEYLVTGDAAFQAIALYGGVRIVSPRTFLQLLGHPLQ